MARYIDVDKLYSYIDDTTIDVDLIDSQPDANVREVNEGYWLIVPCDSDESAFYHFCSCCNMKVVKTRSDEVKYAFCPYCGADMRGEKNEEDN